MKTKKEENEEKDADKISTGTLNRTNKQKMKRNTKT